MNFLQYTLFVRREIKKLSLCEYLPVLEPTGERTTYVRPFCFPDQEAKASICL